MKLHLVSYDLTRPGQEYPVLIKRLTDLGGKRILFSQWMLRSTMTAAQLRDDLQRLMDPNDRLLVADVSDAPMAWTKLMVEIKPAFNLA